MDVRLLKTGQVGVVSRPEQVELGERKRLEIEAAGDRVDISPTVKEIPAYVASLKGLPEIDMVRVENIRRAIDEGTYRIDPEAIADKLLDDIMSVSTHLSE